MSSISRFLAKTWHPRVRRGHVEPGSKAGHRMLRPSYAE